MNTFGRVFRVSLFGESHGRGIGVVIDGVRPGLPLSVNDFKTDIRRRAPGAYGTTERREDDIPEILSGVYKGHTTGAPLTILFVNNDTESGDYQLFKDTPRPGHADFTASVKYLDFNDPAGSGHFSGRLTLPIVAAGVVAKKMLSFDVRASLKEIGGFPVHSGSSVIPSSSVIPDSSVIPSEVEESLEEALPDGSIEEKDASWKEALAKAKAAGDSLGGIVECVVKDVPPGLGEPFFDSVEALVSHAIFSIPGVRGVEFGDGFKAARMKGSEHNDPFTPTGNGWAKPVKNGAGGINGGITNGCDIVFRVAFKPTSSIARRQETFNFAEGRLAGLEIPGRHDVCFALRTPPIVEAMTAIVLADLTLLQ